MPLGNPQGYIDDPRNRDPLYLMQNMGSEMGLDDDAVFQMLLGGIANTRQEAAYDRERAKHQARQAAAGAQQQQAVETQSDEGFLQQMMNKFSPFEQVSQQALQPRQ